VRLAGGPVLTPLSELRSPGPLVGAGDSTGETRCEDARTEETRIGGAVSAVRAGLPPRADCLPRPGGPAGATVLSLCPGSGGRYAARGTARASARADASWARIVKSTCRVTRSMLRTRRGNSAHSCLNRRTFARRRRGCGTSPSTVPTPEGVQAAGLDPDACRGALARGTAVLGRAPLGVRPGEGPRPVVARGRGGLASLHERRLPKRRHGANGPKLAPVVERGHVVALVHDADGQPDAVALKRVQQRRGDTNLGNREPSASPTTKEGRWSHQRQREPCNRRSRHPCGWRWPSGGPTTRRGPRTSRAPGRGCKEPLTIGVGGQIGPVKSPRCHRSREAPSAVTR
jgi:hypothetical protein